MTKNTPNVLQLWEDELWKDGKKSWKMMENISINSYCIDRFFLIVVKKLQKISKNFCTDLKHTPHTHTHTHTHTKYAPYNVTNERSLCTHRANKCMYTNELATDNDDSLQTVSGKRWNSSRHQPVVARLIPNLIKTYLSRARVVVIVSWAAQMFELVEDSPYNAGTSSIK